MSNKLKFNAFLLAKLPAAYFSGLRVDELSAKHAAVSLKLKWLTQNPFRSIYFASLAMAAELSTGLLAMSAIWQQHPTVSMLVFDMSAHFGKKAVGRVRFTCNQGEEIYQAVAEAITTGEGRTVEVKSEGVDEQGDVVATFLFTWTFKQKKA